MNFCTIIQFSFTMVPMGSTDNKLALVPIMLSNGCKAIAEKQWWQSPYNFTGSWFFIYLGVFPNNCFWLLEALPVEDPDSLPLSTAVYYMTEHEFIITLMSTWLSQMVWCLFRAMVLETTVLTCDDSVNTRHYLHGSMPQQCTEWAV